VIQTEIQLVAVAVLVFLVLCRRKFIVDDKREVFHYSNESSIPTKYSVQASRGKHTLRASNP
jgi:hypothetical protein